MILRSLSNIGAREVRYFSVTGITIVDTLISKGHFSKIIETNILFIVKLIVFLARFCKEQRCF